MSVTATATKITYNGNGVLTTFIYPFQIYSDSQIDVVVIDSDGNTTLTLNEDYVVTGAGSVNGGTVVLTDAALCLTGSTITLMLNIPLTQTTDYVDGQAFSGESVELSLDKVVKMVQQVNDLAKRAIKLPVDETSDMVLPTSARENTAIGFDANGDLQLFAQTFNTVNVPSVGTSTSLAVDATGSDQTVYLPASGEALFAKSDSSVNKVIVEPSVVGQTIEGFAIGSNEVYLDVQGQTGRWILLGTNWYKV